MPESRIPVDLFNPGQVFACLGLVEVADLLLGGAAGIFDWKGSVVTFRLVADAEPPVERALRFLERAEVVVLAPCQSSHQERWKRSWGQGPEAIPKDTAFPFPDPGSPATLPVVLRDGEGLAVPINYWGDVFSRTGRDNVKFWAGSAGQPGAVVARKALDLMRGSVAAAADDPFNLSAPQSSSFRFDWRRDYVPLEIGFSINKHPAIRAVGYPLVELLAAVGMTHARPARISRSDKLRYRYGAIGGGDSRDPVDPIFLRAALGARQCPVPGMPFRRFVMNMAWPGRAGDARCITHVNEENTEIHDDTTH